MSTPAATRALITLRELHALMIEDLERHYLDRVATIAAYDPFPALGGPEPQPLTTPALLLELVSIDPGDDDGTDRLPLRLSFAAHCVLSLRTRDVQIELREFAADVLARVRDNRWGYPAAVRAPEALAAQPGEFQPEQAGFDSWLVTWEQVVHVGLDSWAGGIAPTEVWLGIAPKIGAAHVDDYFRINEAPV
jgi:hypothetical protein